MTTPTIWRRYSDWPGDEGDAARAGEFPKRLRLSALAAAGGDERIARRLLFWRWRAFTAPNREEYREE